MSAVSNSHAHVLALAGNFSSQADSHLVTIENDAGEYSTQAINIHNRARTGILNQYYVMNYSINSFTGASEAPAYGGYVKKLIH